MSQTSFSEPPALHTAHERRDEPRKHSITAAAAADQPQEPQSSLNRRCRPPPQTTKKLAWDGQHRLAQEHLLPSDTISIRWPAPLEPEVDHGRSSSLSIWSPSPPH